MLRLRDRIQQVWPDAPQHFLFDEIFAGVEGVALERLQVGSDDPVTIIYTSGTSGEAKGVVLTAANVGFMLGRTSDRLDALMNGQWSQDRAGQGQIESGSSVSLFAIQLLCVVDRAADVSDEAQPAHAQYRLDEDCQRSARGRSRLFSERAAIAGAHAPRNRRATGKSWRHWAGDLFAREGRVGAAVGETCRHPAIGIWLWLANALVFPKIRAKMAGANLKALICGSAPLNPETQLYFRMLGIPVLQVYGLTETTAICTMDDPQHVEPGRVGPAISGIEMRLGENEEMIVRGPNVFPGYWNRPQQTAEVLRDGWFHTGDQGEMDASGNWRIVGRIKNLIVLGSGHKISPEAIEDEIARVLPGAQQVVVIGNGRGYLSAIVTGTVTRQQVQDGAGCGESSVAALQAGAGFLSAAGAVFNRRGHAYGERKTEARPDRIANESGD